MKGPQGRDAYGASIAINETGSERDQWNSCGPESRLPFPFKLYAMLEYAAESSYSCAVSWDSDGKAFAIHDTDMFMQQLVPKYFKLAKFRSFRRQLNLWGFTRRSCHQSNYLNPKPNDEWFREHFIRGNTGGLKLIKRKSQSAPEQNSEDQMKDDEDDEASKSGRADNDPSRESSSSKRNGNGYCQVIIHEDIMLGRGASSVCDSRSVRVMSDDSFGPRQMEESIIENHRDWDILYLSEYYSRSANQNIKGSCVGKRKRVAGHLSILVDGKSGDAGCSMGPKKFFLKRKRIMDAEKMRRQMNAVTSG
mmetsp:Transcript_8413/g.14647  ORF Transcript_8413/g.14647 Transcript_8413/m.14647 type:complete len:307 (-) Transcript_8413:137-1057(-)